MNYYIKDTEWKVILEKLKMIKRIHTRNEFSLRLFIEGVWYVLRSGCQWRLLPEVYGKWRTVHMRFREWSNKGIWELLFYYVHEQPDMENVMLDSTIVRAHACSAGYKQGAQANQALGRSKGGFSTKIHVLVDALGNPLKFILTPGQRHDITQAENLLQATNNTVVIADKSYDSNAFVQKIKMQNSTVVIPPRKNRKVHRAYDKHIYKERHLVECFFSKIKYFRRIFSRFDKTASTSLSFLHLVGVLILIR